MCHHLLSCLLFIQVPLTGRKASKAVRDVDPNEAPRRVALVNAKYVTYGRVTRDLAVVLFTSSSSLIRRYYLIKMVQFYVEKLGETLCQLGIDTDKFGIRYQGRKHQPVRRLGGIFQQ